MKATPRTPADELLLDVKLLRFFDLLYSTRRLGRTAEQLGQSAPTASIWLQSLRTALQDPLFVRTAGGLQPTPRADAILPAVREALRAIRSISLPPADFEPATADRLFRVCMSDASVMTLLPGLLTYVREHAPGVRLESIKLSPATATELETGEADLAIGYVPELDAGFYQQALFEQGWVCLVNASHPRIGSVLDRKAYMREGHIHITYGTGERMLEDALRRARIERRKVLQMPVYLGVPSIVSSSDLIATVPSLTGHTLASNFGLNIFPCPFPVPPFTVKQYWHERYHQDAGNHWLRRVFEELYAERPPARRSRKPA